MYETMQQDPVKELAQRTSAGLEVTLCWSAEDDLVTVEIVDLFGNERFQMAVSHDRASYAFNHPFAYAAEQDLAPTLPWG